MTEREKYFSLQALVCEKLPYYAAQLAAKAEAGTLTRMQNVKAGKVISLADLVALVRHALPDFEIPAHLLPEVAEREAIA
ncbi:hypothetical protein [Hymenobacter baengnokdamensis]|uniref:hypothetical protein n=1 Tax=Hymenobacter baengnokdamensis TaxID=2615203 RepID=UPI0012455B76|nr:hypothetical protein [Hymenobacter baengnokdamensis]